MFSILFVFVTLIASHSLYKGEITIHASRYVKMKDLLKRVFFLKYEFMSALTWYKIDVGPTELFRN